jgi:hypothetical protein
MNQVSDPLSPRQELEKTDRIKRIAYRLWLVRRDNDLPGNAERDYFQAERLFESQKKRRLTLLGSFGFWALAFLLERLTEEQYANGIGGLHESAEESNLLQDF